VKKASGRAIAEMTAPRAGLFRRPSAAPITRSAVAAVREQGDRYPLLMLRMGIAVHQAMIDACAEFAREDR
jgi:hypothetical protein